MIQLQLQPEIEAQLAAEADAHGLPIERYLETIVVDRPKSQSLSRARQQEVREAIARILKLREDSNLNGLSVKDLVNEGRKY